MIKLLFLLSFVFTCFSLNNNCELYPSNNNKFEKEILKCCNENTNLNFDIHVTSCVSNFFKNYTIIGSESYIVHRGRGSIAYSPLVFYNFENDFKSFKLNIIDYSCEFDKLENSFKINNNKMEMLIQNDLNQKMNK